MQIVSDGILFTEKKENKKYNQLVTWWSSTKICKDNFRVYLFIYLFISVFDT